MAGKKITDLVELTAVATNDYLPVVDVSDPTDNASGSTKKISRANLVTGLLPTSATTASITDSTNKRYVTDAELTVLGNTSGTNTGDQIISDATISTSDITTNNVSTSKHGFVPKLPGNTTTFLRGDGAYATPDDTAATWGSVTGTLSSQTDLQTVLDAKVAKTGSTMTGTLVMTPTNQALSVTGVSTSGVDVVDITDSGVGAGLKVVKTDGTGGNANAAVFRVQGLGTDTVVHVQRTLADASLPVSSQALLKVQKDNSNPTNDTGALIYINNLSTAGGTNGVGLLIDSQSTTAYDASMTGKLLLNLNVNKSGGLAINATRNNAEAGSQPLVNLNEQNASNTSGMLKLINSGTGFSINITDGSTTVFNIAQNGSVSTGVWSATAIAVSKGGTGQITATAGFDALSPMTTLGDIIYGGASGTNTRLAGNTTNIKKFLRQTGTGSVSDVPAWDTLIAGDIPDLSATYQPLSTNLTTIGALSATTDNFIVSVASAWASRTPAQVKTTLALNNVENTALSTWAGSANITTLGTIATGVWSGTAIDHTKLTGIVQSDVGGLTTASSPTFAGLSLGTGNINTVGNIEIDGTAARDITVGANASAAAGQALTITAGNAGAGTDIAGGNLVLKTGSGTGTGSTQFQIWLNQPASSTGSGVGTLVNAFLMTVSSAGSISIGSARATAANSGSLTKYAGQDGGTNSNRAGGEYRLQAGQSTGTGSPGQVTFYGSPLSPTSGGTQNAAIQRYSMGATKVLTNNSAISLVNFTLTSNTVVGAIIRYAVEVFNGTDLQMETGEIMVQGANKGGVFSGNTITQIGSAKQFLGSGTLAMTWAVTGANPAVLSLNANSSLTPSTGYPRITYTIENLTQQAIAIQ